MANHGHVPGVPFFALPSSHWVLACQRLISLIWPSLFAQFFLRIRPLAAEDLFAGAWPANSPLAEDAVALGHCAIAGA